ncbi:uncharacterized protein V1518DRAFT_369992 [Limtongia smithiae]|uniref:uncharacterized protein n=1 Tax=Limtongia smithiae TaxID=1125753 RepID=UPI0034CF608D
MQSDSDNEQSATVADDEHPREQIAADEDILSDLPSDVDAIDLVQMRIKSIPALGLSRFTELRNLCLRENQIEDIIGLEDIGAGLVELDLYDNKISRIENLGPEDPANAWKNIESLDLSFNKIKKINHVSHLHSLRNIYFVQDKISKIENLDGLTNLINLELGGNRVRKLENLEKLTALTQLWVGKNKITKFENLSPLRNLKILSIQSNRLTKIEGLEDLLSLEELYMSHNGLTKIEGLEKNTNLTVLDIQNNMIKHVENVSHLSNLQEFWATSNQFESFEEIESELKHIDALETVYFEGNPLQRKNLTTYRNKVRLALGPGIRQIDASYVTESQAGMFSSNGAEKT